MKKIRTVLALAVLVPMLSACGPAPEDVCEHMMGIMKKELGEALPMSDDDLKKAKEECVKSATAEKEKMGAMEYKKQASYIMDANSFADMEKCEKKEEKK